MGIKCSRDRSEEGMRGLKAGQLGGGVGSGLALGLVLVTTFFGGILNSREWLGVSGSQ